MKYNPKINDEAARMPGFSQIHPLQPEETVQGALKLAYLLQGYISEITGMEATSLATLAGAQGELGGMLMIRAYHLSRGEGHRKTVLVPDSAHGTNPGLGDHVRLPRPEHTLGQQGEHGPGRP